MVNRIKCGLNDSYSLYKGSIEKPLYRKIIQLYYSKVIDRIILDNLNYKFGRVGSIYIGKVKPKLQLWDEGVKPSLPIDWVNTKKYGKIIFHMNKSRYGYLFRIRWERSNIKHGSTFQFIGERYNFKRRLSGLLQDEDIKIDAPLID
ncbi:MAG: hypothetical protein KAH32_04495 [Chlamydiia bacterium]|nr:hypothetical protein [Chlamydiia bacterium]